MLLDDNILYKFNIDSKSEELIISSHKILRQYGGGTSYKCKRIFIGKSVEEIDKGFFTYFKNVCKIEVDPENAHFISVDNCLIRKESNSLIKVGNDCTKIPDNIEAICDHAFEGYKNKNYRELLIPESIKTIEADSFKGSLFDKITIKHEIKEISNFAIRGFDGFCDFPDYYFDKISNKKFKVKFCAEKVSNYKKQPLDEKTKILFDSFISQNLVDFLAKYYKSVKFINYLSSEWVMDQKYKDECFETAKNYNEISPIIMSKISSSSTLPTFDSLTTKDNSLNKYEEDNAYIEKNFVFEDKKNKIVVTKIKNDAAAIFPIKYYGKEVEYKDCYNLNQKVILRNNYDENIVKSFLKDRLILELDCEIVPISFVKCYDYQKIIIGPEFRDFKNEKMPKYKTSSNHFEVNPNNPIYATSEFGDYLYNKVKKEGVFNNSISTFPSDIEYLGEYIDNKEDFNKYKHLKILNDKCLTYYKFAEKNIKFPKEAVEIDLRSIYGLAYDNPFKSLYSSGKSYVIHFGENVRKITPNYPKPFNLEAIKLDPKNKFYKSIKNNCLIENETDCLIMSTYSLEEIPDVKEINMDAFLYGMNSAQTYVIPKAVKKINVDVPNGYSARGVRVFPSLAFNVTDKKFNKILKDFKNKDIPCYNDCGTIVDYYSSNNYDEISYVLFSNNKIIIKNCKLSGSNYDRILAELQFNNIELIGLENVTFDGMCTYGELPRSVQYLSIKSDESAYSQKSMKFFLEYKKEDVPLQLARCITKIEKFMVTTKRYFFEYL